MKSMTEKIIKMTAGCLTLLVLLAGSGRAATWTLANGDRLTGELRHEDATFIEVEHPQLGRLKVARSALYGANPEGTADEEAKPAEEGGLEEGEDMDIHTPDALASAVRPKGKKWKRQVELGYAQQSGAKEQEDLSVRVQLDGREGDSTYRGTARLLQSEADGQTVTERREADFRWRYNINKRLFTQALTTYAADAVRSIDLSFEQQIGGGYRLIDSRRHKANIGLGAVVQYLERPETDEQTAVLGSFFQDYAYQWNRRLKLVQESSFMFSDTGTLDVKSGLSNAPEGSYRLKFNTGLQSKVTNRMSLNLRFEYDYDRSVLESELRADQRLTTSLGYIW
jgi:putative salt-induced outer membrane protein YdiY